MAQTKKKPRKPALRKTAVIGRCFCGNPAIVYAFDTYFCQQHDDELAKSFEARAKMPDNHFDGGANGCFFINWVLVFFCLTSFAKY